MEVSSKAKQEKKRLFTLEKAAITRHYLMVLTAEDLAVVLLLPWVIFLGSLEAVTPTECSTCLKMCGLSEKEQHPRFWNRKHPLFSLLLASFLYQLLLIPVKVETDLRSRPSSTTSSAETKAMVGTQATILVFIRKLRGTKVSWCF